MPTTNLPTVAKCERWPEPHDTTAASEAEWSLLRMQRCTIDLSETIQELVAGIRGDEISESEGRACVLSLAELARRCVLATPTGPGSASVLRTLSALEGSLTRLAGLLDDGQTRPVST